MKRTVLALLVAAVASLGFGACCDKEEVGPAGGDGTSPDNAPRWYQSLVGTRWYCHWDVRVLQTHIVDDIYWDIIDDSTAIRTVYSVEFNGEQMNDTIVVSFNYRYDSDSLKFTELFDSGETEEYYLDTIEKTLTYTWPEGLPVTPDKIVYTLME